MKLNKKLEKKSSSINSKNEEEISEKDSKITLNSSQKLKFSQTTSNNSNNNTPKKLISSSSLSSTGNLIVNSPGAGAILHTYVDEVLTTSATAVLSRQKSSCTVESTEYYSLFLYFYFFLSLFLSLYLFIYFSLLILISLFFSLSFDEQVEKCLASDIPYVSKVWISLNFSIYFLFIIILF